MKAKDTTLTPLWLVHAIGEFDLDPCAFDGHLTAKKLICLPIDGLAQKWHGTVWLNPPYSNPAPFLKKLSEHNDGVALVLASTETQWFHTYVWTKASAILFMRGRPKFLRADGTEVQLMRPTCLVAYGEKSKRLLQSANIDGSGLDLQRT